MENLKRTQEGDIILRKNQTWQTVSAQIILLYPNIVELFGHLLCATLNQVNRGSVYLRLIEQLECFFNSQPQYPKSQQSYYSSKIKVQKIATLPALLEANDVE